MTTQIKVSGIQNLGSIQFTGIEGGFGAGKKAMLVKDIAEIHGKDAGNKYTAYDPFKVDAIKYHNNIWQFLNYTLSGGSDVDWNDNGIPLSCVDNTTRGNDKDTQVGDVVKFMKPFNKGIINEYDNATNGIGIDTGGYGRIWYNADAFLKI